MCLCPLALIMPSGSHAQFSIKSFTGIHCTTKQAQGLEIRIIMSIASKTVIIWIHVVIWIIQISDFGFIRSFHFCPTTCIGSNRKRYPKSLKVSSLSSLNLLEENEFDVYSYTIKLRKPMGMILTEVSSSCNTGICVSSMMTSPTPGNAVLYNLEQMKNNAKNRQVLCLYDKILAVNGDACSNETFEQIMDRFAGISDDTDTELTLGKRKGSVAVQWPNGVCVRCMPGDSIGAGMCI